MGELLGLKKVLSKKLLNALLVAVVFSLTIWSVFRGEDIGLLLEYLSFINKAYLIPCVACVLLFIIGESVILKYLFHTLGTRVRFGHCCLYSFIGFFYSCITPSASGGQPMQVIAMRRDNVPVAVSTVVLAIVTIMYKLVLVVIGVAVLIIRPDTVMYCLDGSYFIIHLGITLNIGCVALLLLLVFRPSIVRKCAFAVLDSVDRIRPLKRKAKLEERLDHLMQQYAGTAEYFRSHHIVIANVFMITLLQRIALFLVTWYAYRAIGLEGENFVTIVIIQAMISVAVDMLPLPGGMGVSENLFLQMFLPLFGETLVLPGMVISRGISYYTQLIISAGMTLYASFALKKSERRGENRS